MSKAATHSIALAWAVMVVALASPCSASLPTTDHALALSSHAISRRLASSSGTYWIPTVYKCKMDMTRPFNRHKPTEPFAVKCSEHTPAWVWLLIVGVIAFVVFAPTVVWCCKRQYTKCVDARAQRREEKQKQEREAALRHKAFLQA